MVLKEIDNVDHEFCQSNFGHKISKYEIACAMSHIKVYEKMIAENIEHALILEDDAYLLKK